MTVHLYKPIEYVTPIMNPNVNHGLWVILMCQCRFTDGNKCTPLVEDVGNGGDNSCRGARK